jgi:hypothetical protein
MLTWAADVGIAGQVDHLEIDHLGAKCDMDWWGQMQPTYILLSDNWKLYPASVLARIESWLD